MTKPLTPLDQRHVTDLAAALPADTLSKPDPRYLEEPRGKAVSAPGAWLARPRSTLDVATIIRFCAEHRIGVVPYAGGTSLVGGQVLSEGQAHLILSVERLNRIRTVLPEENVIIAEAGVILADLQQAASDAGRLFPLSLAAEGTARIGGNLSTNAGGVQVLRYGNARDLCLGLEAVLPDGSVWNGLSRLRKDNTGYDLRNLLVGAEGTLGIITAASLRLFPAPVAQETALLAVPGPRDAQDLLMRAQQTLDGRVTAFELIHRQGIDFLAEKLPQVRRPLDPVPEWSVLLEASSAREDGLQPAFASLVEQAFEVGLVQDGVIAATGQQRAEIWQMRESIPLANKAVGAIASHDISLPLGRIAEFIDRAGPMLRAIAPVRINCFGHLGDGNLHYNLYPPVGVDRAQFRDRAPALTRAVHDLVTECEGSISAEHGIGRFKKSDLERYADPARLAAMRVIKEALDPAGIMNPGAVL